MELVEYAANAVLAMRISSVNEMANLCEVVGAARRPAVDVDIPVALDGDGGC